MTQLTLLPAPGTDRTKSRTTKDRLEVLTALMDAPSFDQLYRHDVITVPGDHAVYGWICRVPGCKRAQNPGFEWCQAHYKQWLPKRKAGVTIAEFLREAEPLQPKSPHDPRSCLICPQMPAVTKYGLCYYHSCIWNNRRGKTDFDAWLIRQRPYPGYGTCLVLPCPELASKPVGLCLQHSYRYKRDGSPGGADAPAPRRHESGNERPAVHYTDEDLFRKWCRETGLVSSFNGRLSLLGLRPLVKSEIQWLLYARTHSSSGIVWCLSWIQYVIDHCRDHQVNSLVDVTPDAVPLHSQKIVREMLNLLRQIYFTREDTKEAGFIETDNFGVRFPERKSMIDLCEVSQRWLRDLLWELIAWRLTESPPRGGAAIDEVRRGCLALSAYLEASAPQGGHDPSVLTADHMKGFVADQRHRAEHGLRSLVPSTPGQHGHRRKPPILTKGTMARHFNGARRVLRRALESGDSDKIGLDRAFIVALPYGKVPTGRRRPFADNVARALANATNLRALDAMDQTDRGMRDIWETLVDTGRRCREVLNVRWDCIDRHNGLPMFWHDQSKVRRVEDGIRIPEWLFERLQRRQAKTMDLFLQRYCRPATPLERKQIALFPRRHSNRDLLKGVCYSRFSTIFRAWMNTLDIGHGVAHQTRHTLATNLLRNGADLTQVKRYLGHVSESMAEHYVHLANTDPRLEDALYAVWVAGPGSTEPGMLLSSGTPMSREEAMAMAIDLSARSTPAEGGFCTHQPVVRGESCPWNLDCENCDKFVLSGADLVYWHRKREQWGVIAERAPDSATADYLHAVFEPTNRAIAGLEQALAAVGLLEEAIALDLRRPQDYFGRVWSMAFRAEELARREAGDA